MSLYAKGTAKLSNSGGGGGGGGSGTVTSVGFQDSSINPIYAVSGSPITTSGTLTITLDTQSKNLVFAGPSSGSDAQPSFRSLVAADLPVGNLTDVGTDGITIGSGTGAVIGSGTTISQHVADTSHNGYLSSTDWNTFNSKQSALTIGNLTDVGTDGISITGGTGAVIGSGVAISQHVADSTHNGYLSSTDWTTFNGKGSGSVTSVSMTVPAFLSISGSPITNSGTLAVTLSGTALPILNGGTGQTTASDAFNALSPITSTGDLIIGTGTNTAGRLGIGTSGYVLTSNGSTAIWQAASGGATTITATAGQNLNQNDAVYIATSLDTGRTAGQVYQLDATNDNRMAFIGFAQASATTGNPVTIQVAGSLGSFSSLSAGGPIYASVTTPGSYQATPPATVGQWIILLGTPYSSTNITINAAGSAGAIKITPGGSAYPQFQTVTTSSATLSSTSQFVNVNYAGTCTITLMSAVAGQSVNIKTLTTNNVVINPASGNIDNSGSLTLNGQYNSVYLVSDGTNWWIN